VGEGRGGRKETTLGTEANEASIDEKRLRIYAIAPSKVLLSKRTIKMEIYGKRRQSSRAGEDGLEDGILAW